MSGGGWPLNLFPPKPEEREDVEEDEDKDIGLPGSDIFCDRNDNNETEKLW